MENTNNQILTDKPYATIYEIKDKDIDQINQLRVYRSSPDGFTFQIRTHKGIGEYGKGKPRKMIANVDLTIEEIENILKYMKSEIK